MPNADFECDECGWADNLFWCSDDYAEEYDDLSHHCPNCESEVSRIYHGSAPAIRTRGGASPSRGSL